MSHASTAAPPRAPRSTAPKPARKSGSGNNGLLAPLAHPVPAPGPPPQAGKRGGARAPPSTPAGPPPRTVKCTLCGKSLKQAALPAHLDLCKRAHAVKFNDKATANGIAPIAVPAVAAPAPPPAPTPPPSAPKSKKSSAAATAAAAAAAAATAATSGKTLPPSSRPLTDTDAPPVAALSASAGPSTPRATPDPTASTDGVTTAPAPPPTKALTVKLSRKRKSTKDAGEPRPAKKKAAAAPSATADVAEPVPVPVATAKANKKKHGPIDLDKQCGVLTADGFPCHRSITCKNHPIGQKRTVAGRSQPYDVLVDLFQKSKQSATHAAAAAPSALDADILNLAALDPDAEGSEVLEGIKKLQPVALASKQMRPWARARPMFGLLDLLRDAIKAAR
ncbi:hypothetical protein GGF32_007284 [Allomyces javanicus]|nr:hypothetical protein GGF32_007284 [Allomyces javanicus]